MNKSDELKNASDAVELLKNGFFKSVFTNLEQLYYTQWSQETDNSVRETLWYKHNALKSVESEIRDLAARANYLNPHQEGIEYDE